MKIGDVVTDKHQRLYDYELVDGGFEIVNGPGVYNRPLYGPHCRDLASFDERLLAVVGDSPDALVILINWRVPGGGGCAAVKMGHLFMGIRDGKWFNSFATVKARYVPGYQEYELQDPSVTGIIRVTYVRPVEFEGLLVRVELPDGCKDDLVVACGGATTYKGENHYDYQGGRGSSKDFHSNDCEGCEVRVDENAFGIRRPQDEHGRTLYVTVSLPMRFAVRDAAALSGGPGALLGAEPASQPMGVGTCVNTPGEEIYLLLTTDDISLPEIKAYLAAPGPVFKGCCQHYWELSEAIQIDTPDPYLNLGLAAQILGQDSAWHDPCFTHGPWSWATPYAGWRICYGPTVLGWHDRVQSSTAEFFPDQPHEPESPSLKWRRPGGYVQGHVCRGAVPDVARRQSFFYNMGEVLVDHILYDWEWTGDLGFMAKAFEFIAGKLLWEERLLDADGDGLYENWLNTWVSDAHWYNGGGCIQASAYNWRANKVMADAARRLGRDPGPFEQRAVRIKAACDKVLWVPEKGVYAEYRDAVGLNRLHEAPEQASVYHPIDFRLCDDFQSYQMLRYTEYAIQDEVGTTPRNGRLVWSSNWMPALYSSMGLYPQETINLMLCYYRLGLADKADALLKGVEASFFMGPCPGGIAHNQRPDGSHYGSTDFTDTTSVFIRTVVEGLFGVQMNAPEGRVTVQPCFPRDWRRGSIQARDVACDYTWDGKTERISIATLRQLSYRVRLMARTPLVGSVRLDGMEAHFTLEPGIGCTWVVIESPVTRKAQIEVTYLEAGLPALRFDPVAAVGEYYVFRAEQGKIAEIFDPQGIVEDPCIDGEGCRVKIRGEAGWHTFFALVETGEMSAWLPVDVELRQPVEIVDTHFCVDGYRVGCAYRLRNNTQRELRLWGRAQVGGARRFVDCTLPAFGRSKECEFGVSHPAHLSPGSNRMTAVLNGDCPCSLAVDVVEWRLAEGSSLVKTALASAKTVTLGGLANQRLVTLHEQSYLEPRPKTYSIMVGENGRSIWDWNARGYCKVEPHTERLHTPNGVFISDIGVPFEAPAQGADAVFTAVWENFPRKVTIPVGLVGHKVYFLVVAATHPMQSRIENARITVHLAGGGQRALPLVNPDNLDDWLSNPYAESGFVQYIGDRTHALILDVDVGQERLIEGVELECLSNEALIGLIGVTVL